jgi:hypothetical protein
MRVCFFVDVLRGGDALDELVVSGRPDGLRLTVFLILKICGLAGQAGTPVPLKCLFHFGDGAIKMNERAG